jgi:hypothetical protein
MTTVKNRRNASIWTQYLKTKPDLKAHKFELMELVDMSSRSFEGFKAWYLWKMGINMKYENDEFTYRPDLKEEVVEDEEVIESDSPVEEDEVAQE